MLKMAFPLSQGILKEVDTMKEMQLFHGGELDQLLSQARYHMPRIAAVRKSRQADARWRLA